MMRYFIYLSYNGTNYSGWQVQPNGDSIQQQLETALSTILRHPVAVVGAGRTDAGVHAQLMPAHIELNEPISDTMQLVHKLNRMLPKDIAIRRIIPVKNDAHARFDAISRTYKYVISMTKDPFCFNFAYRVPFALDFEAMNKACDILFEYTDFTSFSKLHTDTKTNNCRIIHAAWREEDGKWVFTITADRFLRNMVRAIVGTLFDVGRGKINMDGFRQIIEAKNRCSAGSSAPGHALYLYDVAYPEDIFDV